MATEQIEEVLTGDPKPKPGLADEHRTKLDSIVQQMIKNKESDSTIQMVVNDFKQKYSNAQVEQKPQQPIQQSPPTATPAFKPMTDWLNISQAAQPMVSENAVNEHTAKTSEASERVKAHLNDIDNSIRNLLHEHKRDLLGRVTSQNLAVNPKEGGPVNFQAQQLQQKDKQDVYVSPVEVESFKSEMPNNPVLLRRGLDQKAKDLTKTNPAEANALKADIYRLDRQNNPEKESKISKNIDKINTGELDYDIVNGQLTKPIGFFGGLVEGFKEKNKAFEDFEVYETKDESDIIKHLNKKITHDADEPTIVGGEAGMMIGGQPLKPIAGGLLAGAAAGPAAGTAAMAMITGPEMYKLGYANALPQNYAAIKKQNPNISDVEAYHKASELADKQASVDAATGMAMGLVGGKLAFKPTGLNAGLLQKSLGSALLQIGEATTKKTLEGLGVGTIGASGQVVKNIMAQKAGLPVDTDMGIKEQLIGGVGMTMGMAMIAKFPEVLKPKTYNQILQAFKGVPKEAIESTLGDLEKAGEITPEQSQAAQKTIQEHQAIDNSIKPNVPEADRLKVQELIKKRNELEGSLETEDKAYHADTKEKIKALNDQINSVSKGEERGELQKLIDKEHKEGNLQGFVTETLKDASENDLKKYFKEISEQAHDPNSEATTIATFGENIVNKAKELYPKEEPKASSISVIQPGEIKHPATITIKPQENALSIGKPAEISLGETSGHSAPLGERIPESGEITGTQEGGQSPIKEENPTQSQEGKVGEPEMVGITHAEMDKVSRELGLPEYSEHPETFEAWTREAKDRIAKDPDSINKLINKLRKGESPDPVETQMMKLHFAALKDRYNNNPTPDLLAEINRTKDLYNISGRALGKGLVARKGLVPEEDTLADFHMRDVEFNKGAPLTEEQTAQSTKEFNEIKAAKDALEEKVAKLEANKAKEKAQKEVAKIAKTTKKEGGRDYKAEREKVLQDMKKKWDESKGQLSATIIPYADRLVKIAPDAAKLIKLLVEEGIEKLPELVKAAHDHLKNFIPEITEKDVHDLIAGEYNTKKPTRNNIQEQLYDLRTQAKLINKLEALESGVQPKSERNKRIRNQEIEELRQKIKDLEDGSERTNDQKLAALKSRYKNKITEIEEKIRKGDYGPDEKPEPIELDKEGKDLRDKYLELKEEREIRLLKDEYANRGLLEKSVGVISKTLKTGRTLQSSFDVSYPYRQTLPGLARQLLAFPFTKEGGTWKFDKFQSQKSLADQFGKMYRSFGSEKVFRAVMDDIHNDPRYEMWKEAGLEFADPISNLDRAKEEMFQKSYAEDIPGAKHGVKASHRAATVIANKMKWDIANELAAKFQEQGKTFANSKELYEATAKYANQLVGRGILGEKLEMAAPVIAHFVYSLRLYASRLQLLTYLANPRFYTKIPKEIRVEYLKDMAKFVALGGTIMGLASAAGLSVGLNPFNSNFGMIEAGNTKYDIWGGAKQYVVLFARLIGGKANASTDLRPLFSDEKGSFREKSRGDVLTRFLRTKASPELGAAIDITSGKDFNGNPVTVKSAASNYFTPLLYKDVADVWKDGGVGQAMITFILAAHGVGVQTYAKDGGGSSGGAGASSSYSKKSKPTRASKPHKTHR